MEIKICTTTEWSEKDWSSYVKSFNLVFQSNHTQDQFKQSYLNTIDGYAYHALLMNNNQDVVGSCTVIPLIYKNNGVDLRIGQAVGVFIVPEYRTDPLMMRRMYHKLKEILITRNIVSVLAVPNATSYPYWRNIVKWRDVGDLPYWILPIKFGNIIKKWKFLNIVSSSFVSLWLFFNAGISYIVNSKQKKAKYELVKNEIFYKYRYSAKYNSVSVKNIFFTYILYNEKGVNAAYLLEATEDGYLTFRSLIKAIGFIKKNTKADIVLFIGTLNLFQSILIRVPKNYEPKRLPLTCDILQNSYYESYSDMYEFSNWNFGLLNYDVR